MERECIVFSADVVSDALWAGVSDDSSCGDVIAEGADATIVPFAFGVDQVYLWSVYCVSAGVCKAEVVPHLDARVKGCEEEFRSFWCADDVACFWYCVDDSFPLAFKFDDSVLDSALEEVSVVEADVVIFAVVVALLGLGDEGFHCLFSFCLACAAKGVA